ncbi:hypothetical protein K7432_007629 [Basidiobolus ranarum]|uniref:Uncharacterized protein n=1 Tax=Basidiobolus ranarum TaxID=34480 RepID=A0ABR2WT28_9FUNG
MPTQRVVDAAVNAIVRTNGCQTRIMIGSWWISILIFLQETLPTKIMDAAMALHMRKTGSWPLDPFLIKDTQDQKTK